MTRVAVIGVGIMGTNHARVLSAMPECELVCVVDRDQERGTAAAKQTGASYCRDVADVIGLVDVAVLATPSDTHAQLGVQLLESGVDLLIEKPIASSREEAARLEEAARASGQIVMVGHIERFNPAFLELGRLVSEPVHLEFTRIGPFTPRVETDVVLDLMIHDLDLALALASSPIESVVANGQSIASDSLDLACALLTFSSGATATLTASRVAQMKVRQIQITQRENFVTVDLVRQDVTVHRLHHSEFLSDGGQMYRQSGLVEIPYLEHRGEPLALELRHFLQCVRERREPCVGSREGSVALDLAVTVRDLALQPRT